MWARIMRVSNIEFLSSAAALGLIMLATPAWSQTASAGIQPQAAADESPSGDIVVTARRREGRLVDVPVSVTVQTGEGLAAKGIDRVDDLQNAIPSLKLTPTAGGRSPAAQRLRLPPSDVLRRKFAAHRDIEVRVAASNNLNLALNWENIGASNFGASAWAKTVTNKVQYTSTLDLAPSFGLVLATVREPRTYGVMPRL